MRKLPVVTFVDIDAAPLPLTEPRESLSDMLEILARERIMIVFCSQRTRAQVEGTRQAFGIFHPFVCEGGGAAFVPERYFGSDIENARKVGGYHAIEFGASYETVVERLRRVTERLQVGVLGFSDMSVEQVARECDLSLLDARLAKLREYAEPFRLLAANPVTERRLSRALESAGLTCRSGAPFNCVSTIQDPRSAIDVLTTLYRLAFGSVITVATEEGTGATEIAPYVDIPLERMLWSADRPASARAWLEAIVQQVDFCRDIRTVVRSARRAR
jgi:mannosyl-3-phosphoglycerate phosphatase